MDHYPGKEEVADYLETYARTFSLPVWLDEPVLSLDRAPSGSGFVVETGYSRYHAAQVVVATGPFQTPFVPLLAQELAPEVMQLHSSQYRNPAQLPEGEVLVVGAGNSGVHIAAELAETRRTYLSVGARLPRIPERLLGRSLFWWLEALGVMDISVETRVGRKASRRDLLIGSSPAMVARQRGVRPVGRAVAATGRESHISDGQTLRPKVVVWATGFQPDFRWIRLPVLNERGRPVHRRGATAIPGLYFLGLSWLHTRGSGLIGWVGRDAAHLAERIEEQARRQPAGIGSTADRRLHELAGSK